MENILKQLDALKDGYLQVWADVCNIESPTSCKAGVDAVAAYFADRAKQRGWQVEFCRQAVAGDVLHITMNPQSKLAPIVLSGHIDTVHPVGLFGTPAVHWDEEKIYGPGVTDCKGGVVAAFLAMDALQKSGYDKRPVKLILQTDEETSSKTSGGETIKYICEQSKDALVFLNLESHTIGKATLRRKGIASYRFDVQGIEGHSSRCVTEGANAIVDAAHKMIALDALKDDGGITCSCGLVSGGTALNTIAGQCSFSVNFRYATQEQYAWIENYVHALAATAHVPGCTCSVEQISSRPAMEDKEFNREILAKINEIFEENDLQTLEGRMLRGGSDAAYVTLYGIPCVDSLGTRGGGSHSIREFAYIASLAEAARRIVTIAYYLQQGEK